MAELFNFQITILLAVLAILASVWKPQEERSTIIKKATLSTALLTLLAMTGWSIYLYSYQIDTASNPLTIEQYVSIWQYFIIVIVVLIVIVSVIRMMQFNRNGFV